MTDEFEETHRTAERALGALREMRLPASPENLELFIAHLAGANAALSSAIEALIREQRLLTPAQAMTLYREYFPHRELSGDVIHLVEKFEEEVAKIATAVHASGANAAEQNVQLDSIASDLKKSAQQHPAIATLVDSVMSVTRSVRDANRQLESQLQQSSQEVSTLRTSLEHIQLEAMHDALTGVKNRKAFDIAIEKLTKHSAATGEPLALALADVDFFKKFNDKWGHQTGDQVLRLVAEVMNANVKGQDVLARFGGEEFAILLPGTTLEHARMLADRIRRSVESRRLKRRRTDEDLGVVTMSMGVSMLRQGDTIETLIERADECLYAAKAAGRNRVVDEREHGRQSADIDAA